MITFWHLLVKMDIDRHDFKFYDDFLILQVVFQIFSLIYQYFFCTFCLLLFSLKVLNHPKVINIHLSSYFIFSLFFYISCFTPSRFLNIFIRAHTTPSRLKLFLVGERQKRQILKLFMALQRTTVYTQIESVFVLSKFHRGGINQETYISRKAPHRL